MFSLQTNDTQMKKEIILFFFAFLFGGGNLLSQVDRTRAFELNRKMGMGFNFGLRFEAVPNVGDWGVSADPDYIRDMKAKGFSHIRLPINWAAHAMTVPPYTIDKNFMDTIHWAIQTSIDIGLIVIIDIHNYDEAMANPVGQKTRFEAIWDQIATEFKDFPTDSLVFELLNEPFTANMTWQYWNDYMDVGIKKIRETNPDRIIILTSAEWSPNHIVFPKDDPYLLLTSHYYEPFTFTTQGADWAGLGDVVAYPWDGNIVPISDYMNMLRDYSNANNIPIYIGEFGVPAYVDGIQRMQYANAVCDLIRERNFSGAHWYDLYDAILDCYQNKILKALLPNVNIDGCVDCDDLYSERLINNNTFNTSWQNWNFQAVGGANANIKVVDGEAQIAIVSAGQGEYWCVEFIYNTIPLKDGHKYRLTFDAYAGKNGTKIVPYVCQNYSPYSWLTVNDIFLSTQKTTYIMNFTFSQPGKPLDLAQLHIACGYAGNGAVINFDNIYLVDLDSPVLHTVTFNPQGGSYVNSQSVEHGGKAQQPSIPTRDGCVFDGWYKEKDCINIWNFDADIVNNDMMLYANWKSTGAGFKISPVSHFAVYPNPTKGKFSLSFEKQGNYRVRIFSISGTLLFHETFADQVCRIDINSYHTGVYQIVVDDGEYQNVMKIIKK